MGIDRSDDSGESPATRPDHPAGRPDVPADHGQQSRREQIEPRSREEAYADLRAATESQEQTEPAGRSEPGALAKPREPPETGKQPQPGASWDETAELSRWMWGKYKLHFPAKDRPEADRSKDPPGTWYGEGDRKLGPLKNQRIEAECDRIANREEKEITPALHAIEGQDPHRRLVGFEYRLKDRDRIKEKVVDSTRLKGHSVNEAISLLPDAIRYTFQYDESRYTQGVRADIGRMKDQGFRLEKLNNYWSDDQYKGINSQWIEPRTGQRFELQFHTSISFEAKQITHPAYERLRTKQADAFEELVLEAFQKKVAAEVPIPPGAINILDDQERSECLMKLPSTRS